MPEHRPWPIVALSLGLVLGLPALEAEHAIAAARQAPWDERSAVAELLEHGVAVAPLQAEARVALAGAVGAGQWPNPDLSAAREQVFSPTGGAENRLELSVPVPLLRLAAERELALGAGARAQARAESRLQELVGDFRLALSRAHFAEARADAVRHAMATYDEVARIVAARVAGGEEAKYDLQRVRLARSTASARLTGHEAAAREARLALAGALGRPVSAPLELAEAPTPLPSPEGVAALLDRNPALHALRLERQRSQRSRDLAESRRWPDPALALGLKEAGGLGYTAGISWPVPLFDRQQGALAVSGAEEARWEAEERALRTRLAVEAAQALEAIRERRAAAAMFASDGMVLLPDLLKTAKVAYREGQAPIVTVLDAHEAALEARLEHLALLESAHEAELRLDRILGASFALSDRRNP